MAGLFAVLAIPLPILAEDAEETESTAENASQNEGVQDLLAAMDREADPCQDFYRYACGNWLDTTELPSDQSRWARSFSVIQERNREVVRDLLEEAAEDPGKPGTDRYRIGHFYASCMDEAAIEKAGTGPLHPWLEEIAKVEDPESLMRMTAKLQKADVGALFNLGVVPDFKDPETNIGFFAQGGLGLPDRDYYVSEDPQKKELLAAYEKHVAHMLGLLGEDAETAAQHAAQVVALETRLAEASRPRPEMRLPEKLYHKIDRKGLQELTPKLPWDVFFTTAGHPKVTSINVATPEFFEALDKTVAATEIAELRTYLRWHTVNAAANLLPDPFVQADFEFYGKTLSGQQEIQPRWKRCVAATEGALGEAVGKLYVEKRFAGDSKEVALTMIRDIEAAFEANLPELAWMDDETRKRAVEKAHAIGNKIGYPDKWRDYSTIEIGPGSYVDNALAAVEFEFHRQMNKIAKPVDETEWGMTPQRVNAYYHPLHNEIVFPAGILQPPFFHRDFPAAMSYGAIGAVMGHELTHGFDDQGRKFAPDGQLREWWEPQVAERFEERAQCVRDLYSGYEVLPGVHIQGDLTAGENIADFGGVKQAYEAYKRWQSRQEELPPPPDGLTHDQLFFVAYAQVWCALSTPEVDRLRVTVDPHSPPRFRVIGPMSNNPIFAEAFGCEEGTPMHPKQICEVW